jgi:hypothetical protein
VPGPQPLARVEAGTAAARTSSVTWADLPPRGERQGQRDGEQRLLLKMLRVRFGELPAVVARIEAAQVADIEVWGERAVTASRLDDVLGPTPA